MESAGIRVVDATDAPRAIAVQTMAFAADPVMRWLFPEPQTYLKVFPAFAHAFGGAAFEQGTAYLYEDLGGASFWLPPGVATDPDPLVKIIEEEIRDSIRDDVFALTEQMAAFHIEEPHWYLAMIGVDPSRRGQGLGGAMLQHCLQACDEQGITAYLESSNLANVSLYQRHGFEIIGEIQAGSSPPSYPMIRA